VFAGDQDELAEGEQGAEADGPGEPNPALELFLTRGVEIVAALAFVVMLFLALRGGKKPRKGRAAGGAGAGATSAAGGMGGSGAGAGGLEIPDEEIDPVLLARTQIEEIVRTDPRRVGEILSRWASDESKVGAK